MTDSILFRLPTERGQQLRTLARTRNTTITEVIAHWINQEIAAGTIPDTTPGFPIEAVKVGRKHAVSFGMVIADDQIFLPPMRPEDAISAADALERIATKNGAWLNADLGADILKFERAGTGVVIEIIDGVTEKETRRVVPRSVALDIARQLRSAAAKARRTVAK